jgi:hypothetical protein
MAEEESQPVDGTYLSLISFFCATLYYFFALKDNPTIDSLENLNTAQKSMTEKYSGLFLYFLIIIFSQWLVNGIVLNSNCGGDVKRNIIVSLFMTLIPWVLIFGAVIVVLIIFPGFKSPFSNVIGYFIVSGQANNILTTILKNTDIDNKIDTDQSVSSPEDKKALTSAAEAILKLCGNTGILVNQMSPDNFAEFWQLLIPLMKDEYKYAGAADQYKQKLFNLVLLRDNIGEALWYIYTAVLLVSIVQMNLSTRGCMKDPATMEANRQKYLDAQAQAEADKEKLQSQTYTL